MRRVGEVTGAGLTPWHAEGFSFRSKFRMVLKRLRGLSRSHLEYLYCNAEKCEGLFREEQMNAVGGKLSFVEIHQFIYFISVEGV